MTSNPQPTTSPLCDGDSGEGSSSSRRNPPTPTAVGDMKAHTPISVAEEEGDEPGMYHPPAGRLLEVLMPRDDPPPLVAEGKEAGHRHRPLERSTTAEGGTFPRSSLRSSSHQSGSSSSQSLPSSPQPAAHLSAKGTPLSTPRPVRLDPSQHVTLLPEAPPLVTDVSPAIIDFHLADSRSSKGSRSPSSTPRHSNLSSLSAATERSSTGDPRVVQRLNTGGLESMSHFDFAGCDAESGGPSTPWRAPAEPSLAQRWQGTSASMESSTSGTATPRRHSWEPHGPCDTLPYLVLDRVAAGIFGQVYRCVDTHGTILVAKCGSMSKLGGRFLQEAQLLARLDHPYIVKLIDVVHSSDHRRVYLIMEYLAGGPLGGKEGETRPPVSSGGEDVSPPRTPQLYSKSSPLIHSHHEGGGFGRGSIASTTSSIQPEQYTVQMRETLAGIYFRCVADALRYLHSKGIVHGDIKPANIVCNTEGTLCKLVDFGASFSPKGNIVSPNVGTPAFLAPECFHNSAEFSSTSQRDEKREEVGKKSVVDYFKCDLWALGVSILTVMIGENVVVAGADDNTSQDDVAAQLLHYRYKPLKVLSDDLNDLLSQLLEVDPAKRPTAAAILGHRWLQHKGGAALSSSRKASRTADQFELNSPPRSFSWIAPSSPFINTRQGSATPLFKCLVLDPNKKTAALLCHSIRSFMGIQSQDTGVSHRLYCSSSLAEGMKIVEQNGPFDFVFVELVEWDGVSVVVKLRRAHEERENQHQEEQEGEKSTFIVGLSSGDAASTNPVNVAFSCGLNEVLAKPTPPSVVWDLFASHHYAEGVSRRGYARHLAVPRTTTDETEKRMLCRWVRKLNRKDSLLVDDDDGASLTGQLVPGQRSPPGGTSSGSSMRFPDYNFSSSSILEPTTGLESPGPPGSSQHGDMTILPLDGVAALLKKIEHVRSLAHDEKELSLDVDNRGIPSCTASGNDAEEEGKERLPPPQAGVTHEEVVSSTAVDMADSVTMDVIVSTIGDATSSSGWYASQKEEEERRRLQFLHHAMTATESGSSTPSPPHPSKDGDIVCLPIGLLEVTTNIETTASEAESLTQQTPLLEGDESKGFSEGCRPQLEHQRYTRRSAFPLMSALPARFLARAIHSCCATAAAKHLPPPTLFHHATILPSLVELIRHSRTYASLVDSDTFDYDRLEQEVDSLLRWVLQTLGKEAQCDFGAPEHLGSPMLFRTPAHRSTTGPALHLASALNDGGLPYMEDMLLMTPMLCSFGVQAIELEAQRQRRLVEAHPVLANRVVSTLMMSDRPSDSTDGQQMDTPETKRPQTATSATTSTTSASRCTTTSATRSRPLHKDPVPLSSSSAVVAVSAGGGGGEDDDDDDPSPTEKPIQQPQLQLPPGGGGGDEPELFLSLFDGHAGHEAAQFASAFLPHYFQDALSSIPVPATVKKKDETPLCHNNRHHRRDKHSGSPLCPSPADRRIGDAFRCAFHHTHRSFMRLAKAASCDAGTTALCAYLHGFSLYIANCGDSSARLYDTTTKKCRRVNNLHHVDISNSEQLRECGLIARERLGGVLKVTRALGSAPCADELSHLPEVHMVDLKRLMSQHSDTSSHRKTSSESAGGASEGALLILGSDGFWELHENDQSPPLELLCEEILEMRRDLDTEAFEAAFPSMNDGGSAEGKPSSFSVHSSHSFVFPSEAVGGGGGSDATLSKVPSSLIPSSLNTAHLAALPPTRLSGPPSRVLSQDFDWIEAKSSISSNEGSEKDHLLAFIKLSSTPRGSFDVGCERPRLASPPGIPQQQPPTTTTQESITSLRQSTASTVDYSEIAHCLVGNGDDIDPSVGDGTTCPTDNVSCILVFIDTAKM